VKLLAVFRPKTAISSSRNSEVGSPAGKIYRLNFTNEEEAPDDIIERHVVIAWHDELGGSDAIQKGSGLAELRSPSALSKVTTHHDKIGMAFVQSRYQRVNRACVVASEMKI
jgi:hypothetical protein